MPDLEQQLFNSFPEAAVLVREGMIAAANPMARYCMPWLEPGMPAEGLFPTAGEGTEQAGTFAADGVTYQFRRTESGQGTLYLFTAAPQDALTDSQLDSALRQMRTLLAELLVNEEGKADRAVFYKTFHRLFRLMENLDFLRESAQELEKTFRPMPTDLVGLCRRLTGATAPLLAEAGVELKFQCSRQSILVPGDASLLRRLLLELLSNAARAAEGKVVLGLRMADDRAVVTFTAKDDPLPPQQLAAILQQAPSQDLPDPGAGAGLGLTIARRIVALHRGSLLVEWGKTGGPVIALALPTGPLGTYIPVEDTSFHRDGGLDPILTALSDLLPVRLFQMEE